MHMLSSVCNGFLSAFNMNLIEDTSSISLAYHSVRMAKGMYGMFITVKTLLDAIQR